MKKLLNKKGFTLMEMLIVVAIIVILVAVSVPVFSSNLNSANAAVDAANLRAAKSAAVAYALDNEITEGTTYYYDAVKGDIVTSKPAGCGSCSTHKGQVITITWDATGKVPTPSFETAGDCAK